MAEYIVHLGEEKKRCTGALYVLHSTVLGVLVDWPYYDKWWHRWSPFHRVKSVKKFAPRGDYTVVPFSDWKTVKK